MAQPPKYTRVKNFADDFGNETDHSALNAELDKASNAINDIRHNLAILQADDGRLRPDVVTYDSLDQQIVQDLRDDVNAAVQDSLDRADAAAEKAEAAAIETASSAAEAKRCIDATMAVYSSIDAVRMAATSATELFHALSGSVTAVSENAAAAVSSAEASSSFALAAAASAEEAAQSAVEAATAIAEGLYFGDTPGTSLGIASEGTADTASRSDHVHPTPITCGMADMTAGTSALATGVIYLLYE